MPGVEKQKAVRGCCHLCCSLLSPKLRLLLMMIPGSALQQSIVAAAMSSTIPLKKAMMKTLRNLVASCRSSNQGGCCQASCLASMKQKAGEERLAQHFLLTQHPYLHLLQHAS